MMKKLVEAIGPEEVLFSVKAFIAAMLALWIALALGLKNPYWATSTVYIVAQPLASAVTSKALYRTLGTITGAIATVVLVPNLADAPELLTLAMALWLTVCVFVSLLDRTPRSYVFVTKRESQRRRVCRFRHRDCPGGGDHAGHRLFRRGEPPSPAARHGADARRTDRRLAARCGRMGARCAGRRKP